jgi:hypothetical protein
MEEITIGENGAKMVRMCHGCAMVASLLIFAVDERGGNMFLFRSPSEGCKASDAGK